MTNEKLMQPFIMVYHFVLYLIKSPVTILQYASKGFIHIIKKIFRDKEETETEQVPFINKRMITPSKPIDKDKIISFAYSVKNSNSDKIIKGTFEAYNKEEVNMFLVNEGYEVISIELRKPYDIDLFLPTKIKIGDLSFALTQLSTYLKAGIPLIDAVRILAKQTENKYQRKIYEKIVYELLMGKSFSESLSKQGKTFPKLLINMVKTAEMTGDLTSTLDDMAEYYISTEQTRKQMISAMTYPIVIFIIALIAVGFILMFVVPQFVKMFTQQNAELPGITVLVINLSNFIKDQYLWILLGLIIALIVYRSLYTNIKSFRTVMQTIFMKIPVFGKLIIYNEVAMFTKTFASLLNHGVFITDSMEILSKLSNNEIYKKIINRTLINLSKGAKISESFKGEWAFPVVAYEMLVTGENTGQLGIMMEKVADHYQSLHKNLVSQMKSLIEPIMIGLLAIMVGGIILSIIIPMFDIYGQIG